MARSSSLLSTMRILRFCIPLRSNVVFRGEKKRRLPPVALTVFTKTGPVAFENISPPSPRPKVQRPKSKVRGPDEDFGHWTLDAGLPTARAVFGRRSSVVAIGH